MHDSKLLCLTAIKNLVHHLRYAGYFVMLSSSQLSDLTLNRSLWIEDSDQDRFGPDRGEPSSKPKYS